MRRGSRSRLAVALLLVLCTAQLLVSSTVEAHRDIGGPNVIRGFVERELEAEIKHRLENLDSSADRLGWKHERGPLRVVQMDHEVVRDLKRSEEEPRPEPEEGPIWSRAWSLVNRLASPIGTVFDPLSNWGRKLVLNADETHKHENELEREHPRHHDHGLRGSFEAHDTDGRFHHRPSGEHRGPFHRFHEEHRGPFHRFADEFHRGPRRERASQENFRSVGRIGGVSGKRADWVTPVEMEKISEEEMDTKVLKVVLEAVDEFSQAKISPPQEGTACLDVFEEQLKTLVRTVKSALREQVCADDAASGYNICKLSHRYPKTAALMAFAKASVNPVAIAQAQVAEVCVSPDVVDSLQQVEVLASHIQLDDLERHLTFHGAPRKHFDREHGFGKSRFGEMFHRHEHGPRRWRLTKDSVMESMPEMHKHEHDHEHEGHKHHEREHHEHEGKEHGDYWRIVKDKLMERMHKEHEHKDIDLKEHEHKDIDLKEHGHKEDEHHGHEEHHHQHFGGRFFGLMHRLKHAFKHHMHHHKGLGAYEHDCFVRGVHHLKRGLKEEVMMVCSSASSPELTAACEFAKEHKFLAKTYIALKVAAEPTVATHCAAKQLLPPHEFRRYAHEDDRAEHVTEFPRYRQFKVGGPLSFDTDMPHLKRMSGCARHRAHQAFRRALQLRGHLLDVARAAHLGDASNGKVNVDEIQEQDVQKVFRAANFGEVANEEFNLGKIHAREAKLLDLFHEAFPELIEPVRTFLDDSESIAVNEGKALRFPLDPSDPSKGFAELRIHNFDLPASSRKSLLGPAMRHRTVDFPTPFMNGRPHFRISARPRTIPDVSEKVDVEDMKSSKIAFPEEGH